MEVFKLDKAIDNEKLDLELAIRKLQQENKKPSQSLKRRKDLAIKMNDQLYVEEIIEDIYAKGNLIQANEAIKELLEKNGNLQEEVRKLKKRTRISVSKIV